MCRCNFSTKCVTGRVVRLGGGSAEEARLGKQPDERGEPDMGRENLLRDSVQGSKKGSALSVRSCTAIFFCFLQAY